jgi:hypothetical protein
LASSEYPDGFQNHHENTDIFSKRKPPEATLEKVQTKEQVSYGNSVGIARKTQIEKTNTRIRHTPEEPGSRTWKKNFKNPVRISLAGRSIEFLIP